MWHGGCSEEGRKGIEMIVKKAKIGGSTALAWGLLGRYGGYRKYYKQSKLKEAGRRLWRGGCWEGREDIEIIRNRSEKRRVDGLRGGR